MIEWNHLKSNQIILNTSHAMYFNILALLVFITGTIHAIFPFLFAFTPYKLAKKITDGTEKHFKKRN